MKLIGSTGKLRINADNYLNYEIKDNQISISLDGVNYYLVDGNGLSLLSNWLKAAK
jgi:hypothetical protein